MLNIIQSGIIFLSV